MSLKEEKVSSSDAAAAAAAAAPPLPKAEGLRSAAVSPPAQRRPHHPNGELLEDFSQVGLAFRCPFKCCDDNTRPAISRHRREFNAHIGNKRHGEEPRDKDCVKPGKHGGEYPSFTIEHVDVKNMKWYGSDSRNQHLSGDMVKVQRDRPDIQHQGTKTVSKTRGEKASPRVPQTEQHQKSKKATGRVPQTPATMTVVGTNKSSTSQVHARPSIEFVSYNFILGELTMVSAREAVQDMGGLTAEDYNRPAIPDDDGSFASSMGSDDYGKGAAVTADVITDNVVLKCHEYGVKKLGLRRALGDLFSMDSRH